MTRRRRRRIGTQRALARPLCSRKPACKVVVFEASRRHRRRLCDPPSSRCPGFIHDVCSAVHPVGTRIAVLADAAAGGLRSRMDRAVGHGRAPVRRRAAAVIERSLPTHGRGARRDGDAYRQPIGAVVANVAAARARRARAFAFAPPSVRARRGSASRRCARPTAWRRRAFETCTARALFAGIAAHGMLPLDRLPDRGLRPRARRDRAHVAGWPIPARRRAAI